VRGEGRDEGALPLGSGNRPPLSSRHRRAGLFWIKDFDPNVVERRLATYSNASLEVEQAFRLAKLKWLFSIPLRDDDFIAITKMYKGAQTQQLC
jgi:hypothetical protein